MNLDNSIAINRAKYIAWLRTQFPELYAVAMSSVSETARDMQMSGIFDTLGSAFSSVVKSVGSALPALAQTYSQYDLQRRQIKENTERAKQGLPPVQVDPNTGQLFVPTNLPYTQTDLQIAMAGAQNTAQAEQNRMLLILGGIAIVGILFLRSGGSRGGRR